MTTWRAGEWEKLVAAFPGATCTDAPDGSGLVTLPDVAVPKGWSTPTTTVWFVTPVGYPAAQPDCFWASAELRLSSGAMPSNSGLQQLPVTQGTAVWFSWHVTGWRPGVDDVTTYARFIQRRLDDAR